MAFADDMAELVNIRGVMDRTDGFGNLMPAGKQLHSSHSNSNSGAPSGWTWKKGLTHALRHLPPITARASCGPVELSFGQQRLWFLAHLECGSAVYKAAHATGNLSRKTSLFTADATNICACLSLGVL